MGLYGNDLKDFLNKKPDFIPVSFEDYIEFATNESSNIEKLFEELDYNILLSEDGATAAFPGPTKVSTKEAVKKFLNKIIDTIKKIFDKFKETVTTLFTKTIPEGLKKIHETVSLKDSFISKFGKYITYDNLQNCRDNGWEGYDPSTAFIARYPDIEDTEFASEMYSFRDDSVDKNYRNVQNFHEDIDKHIENLDNIYEKAKKESGDIDHFIQEAETEFNRAKAEIKRFHGDLEDLLYHKLGYDVQDQFDYTNRSKGGYIVSLSPNTPSGKVFPDGSIFVTTCKCATEGVKDSRKFVNFGKKSISEIENQNKYFKNLMKESKSDIKTYEKSNIDASLLRIECMKYQVQFEAGKAFITQALMGNKNVGRLMLACNRVACVFYMKTWVIIKTYNKKVKDMSSK